MIKSHENFIRIAVNRNSAQNCSNTTLHGNADSLGKSRPMLRLVEIVSVYSDSENAKCREMVSISVRLTQIKPIWKIVGIFRQKNKIIRRIFPRCAPKNLYFNFRIKYFLCPLIFPNSLMEIFHHFLEMLSGNSPRDMQSFKDVFSYISLIKSSQKVTSHKENPM